MNEDIHVAYLGERGLTVFVEGLSDCSGVDTIARFFCKRFRASILDEIEGPDARVVAMRIEDHSIVVSYDDLLGTKVYSHDPCGEHFVLELAESLREFLKDYHEM